MALRRGFKAEAERLAKDIWNAMNLEPGDCMDAVKLAIHAGCVVRSAGDLVDVARLKELNRIQDDAFFACTFKLSHDRYAVVFNPLMLDTRRNSDVAHEVAHIILGHRLSRLERIGSVAFLACDNQQEEEARWLSGCLLLPRFALIHDLTNSMEPTSIAEKRVLSKIMVDYRVRVTGVGRQLFAGRSRRAS